LFNYGDKNAIKYNVDIFPQLPCDLASMHLRFCQNFSWPNTPCSSDFQLCTESAITYIFTPQVPCDLDSLCLRYCQNFNLEEELKRDTGLATDEELTKPKKLKYGYQRNVILACWFVGLYHFQVACVKSYQAWP